MKIGITYDLRADYLAAGYSELETAEFDQAETIDALATTLAELGHAPVRIGNVTRLAERLVAGERWDLVFNIAEGLCGYGREAQVPALLEAYGVPYTFSDPLVMSLTLHKAMCKRVVQSFGVATPAFALVESMADVDRVSLPYPLFAKPVAEGTGKGVSTASQVNTPAELTAICAELLHTYRQPVLVERFLPGREFTVALLGSDEQTTALGTMEIVLHDNADANVYSYRNKELCASLVSYVAIKDGPVRAAVEDLALRAWRCLGCRDGGRVDVRLDEHGQPQFLEVNPLAGIHPTHSDLPIIATLVGMDYPDLIARILASAARRQGAPAAGGLPARAAAHA